MKIILPIEQDSFNSYSDAQLELHLGENYVTLKVSDSEREISVSKEDFRKIINLL